MTEPVTPLLDWLIAALLLAGSLFALIGSIGLAKFGDFYRRLHGPTKATTLGVGGVLLASALFFTRLSGSLSLHELLVTAFLFVTAPVSAQMLIKAALQDDPAGPPPRKGAEGDADLQLSTGRVPSGGSAGGSAGGSPGGSPGGPP